MRHLSHVQIGSKLVKIPFLADHIFGEQLTTIKFLSSGSFVLLVFLFYLHAAFEADLYAVIVHDDSFHHRSHDHRIVDVHEVAGAEI